MDDPPEEGALELGNSAHEARLLLSTVMTHLDQLDHSTAERWCLEERWAVMARDSLQHAVFVVGNQSRERRWGPVHVVARFGGMEEMRALVALGGAAQLTLPDGDGRTALHCAAEADSEAVLSFVLAHTAAGDRHRDKGGMDPLAVAKRAGSTRAVALLEQRQRARRAAELLLAWAGLYHDRLGGAAAVDVNAFDGELVAVAVREQLLAGWRLGYSTRLARQNSDLDRMVLEIQMEQHPPEGIPPDATAAAAAATGRVGPAFELADRLGASALQEVAPPPPATRRKVKPGGRQSKEQKMARMQCTSYRRSCEADLSAGVALADAGAYERAVEKMAEKDFVAAAAEFEQALGE